MNKSLDILSFIAVAALRLTARLPDSFILFLLKIMRKIIRTVNKDKNATLVPDDLIEIMKNDEQGARAVRRMLLEGRTEQFQALIKGMIKHQVLLKAPPLNVKPVKRKSGKGKNICDGYVNLGVAGSGPETYRLLNSYKLNPACRNVYGIGDITNIVVPITGLEIGPGSEPDSVAIENILRRGISVSLHYSMISSPDMLKRIIECSEAEKTPFRLYYPMLHYPPVKKTGDMIRGDVIGEVCSIRVRATVGGRGGKEDPEIPGEMNYINHPGFDHFLLMAFFGGEVAEINVYMNKMTEKGGQALINCKYEYPGRYGLLECTYAPEMFIYSQNKPYDLEAEIAGSDGIIFLTRGMAERTQDAPITVRTGQRTGFLGSSCGLISDWETAYENAARHFIDMIQRKDANILTNREMIAAYAIKSALEAAGRAKETLKIRL